MLFSDDQRTLQSVTRALSDTSMEGRGTGSPGGLRAAEWIAQTFRTLHLEPLGDSGAFLQRVDIVRREAGDGSALVLSDGTRIDSNRLAFRPAGQGATTSVEGRLSFVGFGVTSPTLQRDDLAGLALEGTIAVLLSGRPANAGALWDTAATEPRILQGLAARKVAAIVVVLPARDRTAITLLRRRLGSSPWRLAHTPDVVSTGPPVVILGADDGRAVLGADASSMLAQAMSGAYSSRLMPSRLRVELRTVESYRRAYNVVGLLGGREVSAAREAVLFTAHYDGVGRGEDGVVRPGAADNALGVAQLIAAVAALRRSPAQRRRSVIVAALTGEEVGLLGSQALLKRLPWPTTRLVAAVNIDGIGTEVLGPVERVTAYGGEYSNIGQEVDDALREARLSTGVDAFPQMRPFGRSDQLTFATAGIPSVMLLGLPSDSGSITRARRWLSTSYHQRGDTIGSDWDWRGPETMVALFASLVSRLTATRHPPVWFATAPFQRKTAPASSMDSPSKVPRP